MEFLKTIEVVAAVIYDGNKIFTTQRGYGEFKDGWEFPGGKVEAGESLEEALKREIREELEADIEVENLVDVVEYDYPNFHLKMHCFMARLVSDSLILKEHEAAKWLNRDELDSMAWLPADVSLIDKLKNM